MLFPGRRRRAQRRPVAVAHDALDGVPWTVGHVLGNQSQTFLLRKFVCAGLVVRGVGLELVVGVGFPSVGRLWSCGGGRRFRLHVVHSYLSWSSWSPVGLFSKGLPLSAVGFSGVVLVFLLVGFVVARD